MLKIGYGEGTRKETVIYAVSSPPGYSIAKLDNTVFNRYK